jgi:hypothetical protein
MSYPVGTRTVKTKKPSAKQVAKARDQLIEQLYYKACAGMQINVLKMGAMFKQARTMLDDGQPIDAIVNAMWGFAENPQARVS